MRLCCWSSEKQGEERQLSVRDVSKHMVIWNMDAYLQSWVVLVPFASEQRNCVLPRLEF